MRLPYAESLPIAGFSTAGYDAKMITKFRNLLFGLLFCICIQSSQGATISCNPSGGATIPFKFISSGGKYSIEMQGSIYSVKKVRNFVSADGYEVIYLEGSGIFVGMYPDRRMIVGSTESSKLITGGYCK